MATLAAALLMLTALTSITLYTSRVLILEQRIARNEELSIDAGETAEAGAAFGLAYLNANRSVIGETGSGGWAGGALWSVCPGPVGSTSSAAAEIPCGDGKVALHGPEWLFLRQVPNKLWSKDPTMSYRVHFLTENDGGGPFPYPTVQVFVEGRSDVPDATASVSAGFGRAQLRVAVRARQLFRNVPPAPLMINGSLSDGNPSAGATSIWGRPDGLGSGVPFSIWAEGEADPLPNDASQANSTCVPNSYPACTPLTSGADVVESGESPGFPADLFRHTFGVPLINSSVIRDSVDDEFPDCISVAAVRGGVYWVSGDCDLSFDVGSAAEPVMLIVAGDVTLNGNIEYFGAIYILDSGNLETLGSPTIHGALIVDRDMDMGGSDLALEYDRTVLSDLNRLGGRFTFIPGSWIDEL